MEIKLVYNYIKEHDPELVQVTIYFGISGNLFITCTNYI